MCGKDHSLPGGGGGGKTGSFGTQGLGDHLPPLERKRHPTDNNTGTGISHVGQVAAKVVNEGALEAQGLQQVADSLFQATGALDMGPKGLGDS